jgi:hypothetical protein
MESLRLSYVSMLLRTGEISNEGCSAFNPSQVSLYIAKGEI